MLDKVKKLLFATEGEYDEFHPYGELAIQLLKGMDFKMEEDAEIADYIQNDYHLHKLAIEYEIIPYQDVLKLNIDGMARFDSESFSRWLNKIPAFENLNWLGLSRNNLEKLPEEILELKKLQYLDLDYNEIKYFPEQIIELKNITTLSLESNNLLAIPSQIFELKQLQRLYLSCNKIVYLPEQIIKLENLETLYLYDNPFKNIEAEMINKLSKMKSLKELWIYPYNVYNDELVKTIGFWEKTLPQLLPNVELKIDNGLPF